MKTLAIFLVGLSFFPAVSLAESLEPEEVVRILVAAAHENDLGRFVATTDLSRIENQHRHGHSPDALLALLKNIKVDQIKFQKFDRKGWPKTTTVRMTAPISMDFDLELTRTTYGKQEDHYRVVAVHP